MFPDQWRRIKRGFSRRLPSEADLSPGHRKRERGIWQRRYWEHVFTDADDFTAHVDYIQHNPVRHGPVRHGLVATMDDWPYSSWHRWKSESRQWALPSDDLNVGEKV